MARAALAVIDMPTVMPKGVTRRQWRLAALLPRCEAASEAMEAAGYSPATARSSALRQREAAGVQVATRAIKLRQRDSARALRSSVHNKIAQRVESDEASDALLVGTYKVTTEAIAAGSDEVDEVGEAEHDAAAAYLCRVARAVRALDHEPTNDEIVALGAQDVVVSQLQIE